MGGPYYSVIVERVKSAVRHAKAAAGVLDHPALIGEVREIALRELVEPFLTHSFRAGTGKIVDGYGSKSKQLDIVIYSTKAAPALLLSKDISLFPIECCRYVIEVKSTLNATELKSAISVGRSVQVLRSFPLRQVDGTTLHGPNPSAVLFAFDSDLKGNEIERYLKYDRYEDVVSGRSTVFNVLIVLGKGYWFRRENGSWAGVLAEEMPEPEGLFPLFIAGFCNTLAAEETTLRPFQPGRYMIHDGIAKIVVPPPTRA